MTVINKWNGKHYEILESSDKTIDYSKELTILEE
jgi:hypothetical protein